MANQLLGTEHLVLGRGLRSTATAMERTTVLIIQRSDIDKLCERDERFRQALISSAMGGGLDPPEGEQLELDPPEGVLGPAKYGGPSLEELGWRRRSGGAPKKAEEPSEGAEPSESRSVVEDDVGALDEVDLLDNEAADLPDLIANATVDQGHREGGNHEGHGRGIQPAIMIWLGILIDSVPESFVMGILVNTSTFGTLLAFVVGVFLANLPEAMSSAGTMALHGMRKRTIMLMWTSITVMTGVGACLGAILFPPGSADDPATQRIMSCIEGLCGGAMLTMIANTVLPEAFEQGGNVTGLSCLLGFLVAIAVSAFGPYLG